MAGLKDLPIELLLQIAACLNNPADLRHLCLTNKSLHQFTTPILYQSFSNVWSGSLGNPKSRLLNFLLTVLERPALGAYTKSLSLEIPAKANVVKVSPGSQPLSWYNSYLNTLDKDSLQRISTAVSRLRCNSYPGLLPDGMNPERAELVLLLCSLPRFEQLKITYAMNFSVPCCLTNKVCGSTVHLSTLKTLNLIGGDRRIISLEDLAIFYALPNLENVEVSRCVEGVKFNWDIPPRSSSITNLVFRDSKLSRPAIDAVVGACRSLEHFAINYYGSQLIISKTGQPVKTPTPGDIVRTLSQHKTSLRSLSLLGPRSLSTEGEMAWSFSMFERLALIDTEWGILCLQETTAQNDPEQPPLLPSSVRRMSIWYPNKDDSPTILAYLSTLPGACRHYLADLNVSDSATSQSHPDKSHATTIAADLHSAHVYFT